MEASPPAAHLWTKRLSGQLRSWLPESRVRHLLIAQNVINIFRAEFPLLGGSPLRGGHADGFFRDEDFLVHTESTEITEKDFRDNEKSFFCGWIFFVVGECGESVFELCGCVVGVDVGLYGLFFRCGVLEVALHDVEAVFGFETGDVCGHESGVDILVEHVGEAADVEGSFLVWRPAFAFAPGAGYFFHSFLKWHNIL